MTTPIYEWPARDCATCGGLVHVRADIPPPYHCQEHEPMKKMKKKKPSGMPTKQAKTNGTAKATSEPSRLERRRYKKELEVAIAPELVVFKADELANATEERDALKVERRESNQSFKERMNAIDDTITKLSKAVKKHVELREVEVVESLVSGTGNVEVVRQDTLEVIEVKAATQEDLQESMFAKIETAKAADAAAKTKKPKRESDSKIVGEIFGAGGVKEEVTKDDLEEASREA